MATTDADVDPSLYSNERLDRESPELFTDCMPAAYKASTSDFKIRSKKASLWPKELTTEENEMLQEYSSLTTSQLFHKVQALRKIAYQLGLKEAHEMRRGKILGILDPHSPQ